MATTPTTQNGSEDKDIKLENAVKTEIKAEYLPLTVASAGTGMSVNNFFVVSHNNSQTQSAEVKKKAFQ